MTPDRYCVWDLLLVATAAFLLALLGLGARRSGPCGCGCPSCPCTAIAGRAVRL